ncbi:MAG: hypothetical protein PHH87_00260 [Desulfuromonas sp.]|nr:hypothetical protein [Desulfuromonas sp.]
MPKKNESVSKPDGSKLHALWEVVALDAFSAPKSSSEQIVRKWDALKRLFQRSTTVGESPFKPESELQQLPHEFVEHLTGPVDWSAPLSAFAATINGWSGTAGEPAVVFMVGPPWSGHAKVLHAWAAALNVPCIKPPTTQDILRNNLDWMAPSPERSQFWIMPELERCYLRHAEGLEMVRSFLEQAMRGIYGPGIIGCDSWAWAYLQYVWPVPCSNVLTLQAFDASRLTRLLRQLSIARSSSRYCFKNASNGKTVLCSDDASTEINATVHQIAARCCGNVGLALSYWRAALRSEPEVPDEEESKKGADSSGDEHIVWLGRLPTSPVLPDECNEEIALLLHTLLLHNGLEEELLHKVLPMPHLHIMALLLRLLELRIVEQVAGRWHIAPLAYSGVCTYLRARNYLLDHFQG